MSESDDTLSYAEAKQLLDDLLARSAMDPGFRKLCLLDGREALKAATGRELPEGVTVHFVEHPGQGAGIVLPPLEVDAASLHGSVSEGNGQAMADTAAETVSDSKPAAAPRGLNIRPKQG